MKIINYPSLYEIPIAKRMLLEFEQGMVMNLQLQKGEKVPRHQAPCEAIIVVTQGEVIFRSGSNEEILRQGILAKLEVEDDHEFEAVENSSIVVVKVNGRSNC